MDQKKIGQFLQTLRKEKELTQEQLAEKFNVSNRTVSRWETGSNMPDISVLVELAEFYEVDIKEIIDGERKSETMKEETKETLVKVAEYTNEDKKQQYLKMRKIIGGAAERGEPRGYRGHRHHEPAGNHFPLGPENRRMRRKRHRVAVPEDQPDCGPPGGGRLRRYDPGENRPGAGRLLLRYQAGLAAETAAPV